MNAGMYVHIPFCKQKCLYCDFYSVTDMHVRDRFVACLRKEIELSHGHIGGSDVFLDTIYIGGGTPSMLGAAHLSNIIKHIYHTFSVTQDCEVTLEVNPGTVDRHFFDQVKNAGVNRISIGVQSFHDDTLVWLGRAHTADEARTAICDASEAGFSNISIDIMHGIPDESMETYAQTLRTALSFRPAHISAYSLSVEADTPLAALVREHKRMPLSDDQSADFFSHTIAVLCNAGYTHYEISNFSYGDHMRSRHNQKYWHYFPYYGIGPSAHSFDEKKRWGNSADVEHYCMRLEHNSIPCDGKEILTREEVVREKIMLGLRCVSDGFVMADIEAELPLASREMFVAKVALLTEEGFINVKNRHITLTDKGVVMYNAVVSELTQCV